MLFNHYRISKGNIQTDTVFIPVNELPDLPISTPFTFPFFEEKVCMAMDKMMWWNPLGGHIDEGEVWEDALKREAFEEAGVRIAGIQVVGYIKLTKLLDHSDNTYPNVCQIPMTISTVTEVDENWKQRETHDRGFFTFDEAIKLLSLREDNLQMLQIFEFILSGF